MSIHMKYIYTILLLPPLFLSIYCSAARVVEVINQSQFNDVVKNTGPTIVEFSASWCGVCQAVKKPFEEVSVDPEFKNVTFARVDVDQHPNLSKDNNIMGVPTFVYLENGNKINQEIGVINTDNFDQNLRLNLRSNFKLAQADIPDTPMTDNVPPVMPTDAPMPLQAEEVEIDETVIPESAMPTGDMGAAPTAPVDATMMQPTQDEQQQIAIVMAEEPAEQGGILANIQNFIMTIINGIIAFFKSIIDAIKGLFGY